MMTRTEAEAIRAEAARTGDVALIRQWNDWCIAERKRMEESDRVRKARKGLGIGEFYISMWGG